MVNLSTSPSSPLVPRGWGRGGSEARCSGTPRLRCWQPMLAATPPWPSLLFSGRKCARTRICDAALSSKPEFRVAVGWSARFRRHRHRSGHFFFYVGERVIWFKLVQHQARPPVVLMGLTCIEAMRSTSHRTQAPHMQSSTATVASNTHLPFPRPRRGRVPHISLCELQTTPAGLAVPLHCFAFPTYLAQAFTRIRV